jgi:hypothetical protein
VEVVLNTAPDVVVINVELRVKSGTAAHTGVWLGSEPITHGCVTQRGVSEVAEGTLHWPIWFAMHARCPAGTDDGG